jgi:hypothetical protein
MQNGGSHVVVIGLSKEYRLSAYHHMVGVAVVARVTRTVALRGP